MTLLATAPPSPLHRPASAGAAVRFGFGVLFVVIAGLTALRVGALFLSPSALNFDEAQYWTWSRHLAFGYFSKPPMIGWVIGAEGRLCGSGSACVRLAAPLVHGATALVVYALGRRLYDARTGFWSAVTYATVPGVAISSVLMTTDVFLLLFWTLALLALVDYLAAPRLRSALLFGAAVGLGLNAKYAMIYLPLMAGLFALVDVPARRAMLRPAFGAGLLLAAALIAPNLLWNAGHGFATFAHTSQNIGWSLARLNPTRGLTFLLAQFGIAGPIVFGALVNAFARGARTDRPAVDRFLLWFSVPVVLAMVVQGFLSQANANWAASAYPAAAILATALVLRHPWRGFFAANLAVGLAVTAGVLAATVLFDPATAAGRFRPLRQFADWSEAGRRLHAVAAERGAGRLVVMGRRLTARLVYVLRDGPLDVAAYLGPEERPSDQFQLETPWRPGDARAGTLIVGIDAGLAEALRARPVATVDPTPEPADRLTVYQLDP